MNTTLSEEKNIEEQKNGIEEKERTAQSSKEERTFEQKRQGLEEKRQGLEEKRWTLEKGLGQGFGGKRQQRDPGYLAEQFFDVRRRGDGDIGELCRCRIHVYGAVGKD